MLLSIWLCFVISTTSALCWIVQVEETYSTGKNYIPTSFCFVVFLFFVELVGNDDSWYAWISLVQANVKLKRERERERERERCIVLLGWLWNKRYIKRSSFIFNLTGYIEQKTFGMSPSFLYFPFLLPFLSLNNIYVSLFVFLSSTLSLIFHIYIFFFYVGPP